MADPLPLRLTRRKLVFSASLAGGACLLGAALRRRGRAAATRSEALASIRRGTAFAQSCPLAGLACLSARTGKPTRLHGEGVVFVAHFVAVGMADLLDPQQRRKLRLRVGRLQTDEVWGYSINAPVDADDTAFALRALRLLGPGDDERVQSGLRGLATFRDAQSGLYRTFKSGRSPIRLVAKGGDEANYQAHPEVNANVLSLLADVGAPEPDALRKLWRWHQTAGVSESFYYPSRLYTLFWLLPLVRRVFPRDRAIDAAIQQVVAMQSEDGSWLHDPLETAMGLQLLSGGAGQAVRAASRRAEAWLIDHQEDDGSWRAVEPIWIFPAPDGDHWRALDQDRLLTTAAVVGALRHVQPSA